MPYRHHQMAEWTGSYTFLDFNGDAAAWIA